MGKFKIIETEGVQKGEFAPKTQGGNVGIGTDDTSQPNVNVVYSITADELVADGYLSDVSYYAKKLGIGTTVRITPNIVNILNGGNDEEYLSWDEWHDELDKMLRMIKKAIIESNGEEMIECDYDGNRIWVMADYTSGDAIHIFTPDEY